MVPDHETKLSKRYRLALKAVSQVYGELSEFKGNESLSALERSTAVELGVAVNNIYVDLSILNRKIYEFSEHLVETGKDTWLQD